MKIRIPTFAVRNGPKGKWHFLTTDPISSCVEQTVCRQIGYTEMESGSNYGPEPVFTERKSIRSLHPNQICRRCIGPLILIENNPKKERG